MTEIKDSFADFEKALSVAGQQQYVLKLYINGATAKSIEAIKNIKAICDEHLPGQYELEVVDLYQQPERLAEDQVIAAPTLIKRSPPPLRKFIGSLSNKISLLRKLGLTE
jgi:circadian clock protein KaiB